MPKEKAEEPLCKIDKEKEVPRHADIITDLLYCHNARTEECPYCFLFENDTIGEISFCLYKIKRRLA